MPTYVDYYGQPTKDKAVADEAMRRNERDLARAQAEGRAVGVDYFGQPTTDPIAIERGAARNLSDSARATDIDNASIAVRGGGSGGAKPNTDEELTSGKSAMKKGGAVKSAKFMSFSKTGKPAGMKPVTKMASGGTTASSRADGIAQRGKTRGKIC
jgi:hypothetical protein